MSPGPGSKAAGMEGHDGPRQRAQPRRRGVPLGVREVEPRPAPRVRGRIETQSPEHLDVVIALVTREVAAVLTDPSIGKHAVPAIRCGDANRNARQPCGHHRLPKRHQKHYSVEPAAEEGGVLAERCVAAQRQHRIEVRMVLEERRRILARDKGDVRLRHEPSKRRRGRQAQDLVANPVRPNEADAGVLRERRHEREVLLRDVPIVAERLARLRTHSTLLVRLDAVHRGFGVLPVVLGETLRASHRERNREPWQQRRALGAFIRAAAKPHRDDGQARHQPPRASAS